MNPLITLAIPIYNVERYVEKSLTSALNQTYDNLEILVIDDKGTDKSMDVVRNIISNHPRGNIVRIIEHDKNQGAGATRNTAIDNAGGEFLFIMDSDDEITSDCVATLYAAMKETPVDFVIGSIDEIDESGNILYERKYIDSHFKTNNDILHSQYNPIWLKEGKSSKIFVPIWNKLYNINFLKNNNIKCIPYQKNEDNLFTFLLFLKANSCRILSSCTYKYNVARPGSTMYENRKGFSEFQLKQLMDNLEYYSSYIDYIKRNTGDASKYLLYYIVASGSGIKRNIKQLNYSIEDCNYISKNIKKLTQDIGFFDIPHNPRYIFLWSYLKSPALFDVVFEKFFSLKHLFKK